MESFQGKLRDECLNASWFGNLREARRKIAACKEEYNEERPHSALGYLTPCEFARRIAAHFRVEKLGRQVIQVSYDSVRGARGQVRGIMGHQKALKFAPEMATVFPEN